MDKPILFSGDMVQAIINGDKRQTRRVVTLKNEHGLPLHYSRIVDHKCPYGKIGDRLWVRETWGLVSPETMTPEQWAEQDGPMHPESNEEDGVARAVFKISKNQIPVGVTWKSSRFMPRWASRITLGIVEVRVEKLQQISHDDAVAEGFPERPGKTWGRLGFSRYWDSLNAKRGYGWDVNPWVWVIKFKVESIYGQ